MLRWRISQLCPLILMTTGLSSTGSEAPTSPHCPVQLILKGLTLSALVTKLNRPRHFPLEVPITPLPCDEGYTWDWQVGELPADLDAALRQWYDNMERFMAIYEALNAPVPPPP